MLERTRPRTKKPRAGRGRVSPELWEAVVTRDAERLVWSRSEDRIHHGTSFARWWARKRLICFTAVTLGLAESGKCSNVQQVDHVWLVPPGVKGKRAPSDLAHLVAMCSYHNVDHPPSSGVRTAERAYLLGLYPEATDEGVDLSLVPTHG